MKHVDRFCKIAYIWVSDFHRPTRMLAHSPMVLKFALIAALITETLAHGRKVYNRKSYIKEHLEFKNISNDEMMKQCGNIATNRNIVPNSSEIHCKHRVAIKRKFRRFQQFSFNGAVNSLLRMVHAKKRPNGVTVEQVLKDLLERRG